MSDFSPTEHRSGGTSRVPRFEELVPRDTLDEIARSASALFGIAIRVYAEEGARVFDGATPQRVCACVNATPGGRAACANVIDLVRREVPARSASTVPCFTGARYHVEPLFHDGKRVGRFVVGPFLQAPSVGVSDALAAVDPALDRDEALAGLAAMPVLDEAREAAIAAHLRTTIELLLFQGHKAWATSQMHVASVRETFRELNEKNARLEEAVTKLTEVDRLKSNFLATVSHELRTPLTSIIGYSEMLAEGLAGPVNAEQADYLATVLSRSEQLLALIVSLLDLSKLESGTMTLRRASIDPGAILSDVVTTLAPTAKKRSITLSATVPKGLPTVMADAEKLRQVFLNLTENALKFTEAGGSVKLIAEAPPPSIDEDTPGIALLGAVSSHVRLTVCDTGVGIPPEERERIFQPFYQVDQSSTRERGGAGLGLAIVKRLVEAHDGTITVGDGPGGGTSIVVELPAEAP